MIAVLPEIEQHPTAPGDDGDLVRPVQRRLQPVPVPLETVTGEPLQRPRILRLDPLQRLRPFDVLKPQKRVVVGCFDGRSHVQFRHRSARCYDRAIRTQVSRHEQPPHIMIEAVVEAGGVVVALALLLYFQVLRPDGATRPPPDIQVRPPTEPADE